MLIPADERHPRHHLEVIHAGELAFERVRSARPEQALHGALLTPAHDRGYRPGEGVGGMSTKRLYASARDAAGAWSLAGRAFEPVTPEAAGLSVASQLSESAGCTVLSYKYAQYCDSNDWIVTTLYCSKEGNASGRGAVIGASRVLLIGTKPVRYLDVTGMVEASQGVKAGTLSSFTGTCRAVN